jgi:hypothetical protein
LGCAHKPDPNGAHYFYIEKDGIWFELPGHAGRKHANWLLLCDRCFIKFGDELHANLRAQRVPIGCATVWDEKDGEVIFPTS